MSFGCFYDKNRYVIKEDRNRQDEVISVEIIVWQPHKFVVYDFSLMTEGKSI